MDSPLVSIIIVTHNHSRFVAQCISSAVNQTYPNTEIIVIDNGSTDNTPEVLEILCAQYGFQLVLQDNIGLPGTLNKAIKDMAKGVYIALCAGDDYWCLDKIEYQVNSFLKCDPSIAVLAGNAAIIDESGDLISSQRFSPARIIEFNDLFLKGISIMGLTSLIRRDIYSKVGWYDPNIHIEDYYMWLKITSYGFKIMRSNKLLGFYRQHSGNVSNKLNQRLSAMQTIYSQYSYHEHYAKALDNMHMKYFKRFSILDGKMAIMCLFKVKSIASLCSINLLVGLANIIIPRRLNPKREMRV
ncbi:MAG: glycosyltransferase [Fermentimonas sp.]|nr:glycosyltransferase [Fermentimonas sp.]